MYIIDKTNKPYRGNNSRAYDYQIVSKDLKSNDPAVRNRAEKVIQNMKSESGKMVSMRESLIKAHRSGNTEEIKDIHDYVETHKKYRHEE